MTTTVCPVVLILGVLLLSAGPACSAEIEIDSRITFEPRDFWRDGFACNVDHPPETSGITEPDGMSCQDTWRLMTAWCDLPWSTMERDYCLTQRNLCWALDHCSGRLWPAE